MTVAYLATKQMHLSFRMTLTSQHLATEPMKRREMYRLHMAKLNFLPPWHGEEFHSHLTTWIQQCESPLNGHETYSNWDEKKPHSTSVTGRVLYGHCCCRSCPNCGLIFLFLWCDTLMNFWCESECNAFRYESTLIAIPRVMFDWNVNWIVGRPIQMWFDVRTFSVVQSNG